MGLCRPGRQGLSGIAPGWVLRAGSIPATVDLDFANNRYFGGSLASLISCSRGSTGYAQNIDGTLTNFASNVPRIGVGQGLLVEESRTNKFKQSNDLTNVIWNQLTTGAATISIASSGTAPDNTSTATLVAINRGAASEDSRFYQTFTGTAASWTCSLYVMAKSAGDVGKLFWINAFNGSVNIGLSSFTLTAVWQRVSLTATLAASASCNFSIGYVAGAGSQTGQVQFYAAFSQSELGSFPTSYIPTTTGSVTRNADNVTALNLLKTLLVGPSVSAILNLSTVSVASPNAQILIGNNANAWKFQSFGATNLLWTPDNSNTTAQAAVNAWNGGTNIIGYSAGPTNGAVCANNGAVGTTSVGKTTASTIATIGIGASSTLAMYLSRMSVFNSCIPNFALKDLTRALP